MPKAKSAQHSRQNNKSPVLQEVARIYEFMHENQLESLEFSNCDMQVRLIRKKPAQQHLPVMTEPALQPARPADQPKLSAPAVPPGAHIRSPLTGIFYRAPSPASPPFVREGDSVRAGQVVCIIEAMKVFNEVKVETDCVISKVLVENGKPVKTHQELFLIEKK